MTLRVLLIDDDDHLAGLLNEFFSPNDVVIEHAPTGEHGIERVAEGSFDAVLLDVMMPGINGLETCRRIRQRSRVPILMVTARGEETDRVVGLELGADDYISKPFSPRELLARIRAVVRRAAPETTVEQITLNDLEIDLPSRSARLSGKVLDLTGIEFDILVALARHAGKVVPRDALWSMAGRGQVSVGDRTVDVHVSHLRAKLEDDPKQPRWIKTVRGVGYILTKSEASEAQTSS